MTIQSITSRDNPLYKQVRQLATSSQARRQSGRTLLDGIHLCEVYLQQRGMPALCVISQSSLTHPEAGPLIQRCDAGQTHCILIPDTLFKAVSQVEHGVDLLFVIDTTQVDELTSQVDRLPLLTKNAILLDNIQDPGNLGSILRSAAAAGVDSIWCSPGTASAWAPKVLRAGMGAHFFLNITEQADLSALIASSTVPVIATSSHSDYTIYALNLKQPVAWLFGHEGQGVAQELLVHATHLACIPQQGAIESLNVAASAAICLFEQVRQRIF
jgi:TrmH family RNA methyltransferase